MSVKPIEIGGFVDSIAGTGRTPAATAGRLLEEVVELALAAGLSSGAILAHVADALHNQALKASLNAGKTVFPSSLTCSIAECPEEAADVSLVLKDLCHVLKIDLGAQEDAKFAKLKTKTFRVTEQGTIYAHKPHIS